MKGDDAEGKASLCDGFAPDAERWIKDVDERG